MLWKKSFNLPVEISFKISNFNKKLIINSFAALSAILVLFFIFVNRYPYKTYSYFSNIKNYINNRVEYYPYELSLLAGEINDYENVFFSFTDSIPENPPHYLVFSQKMVYKIDTLDDINHKFPNLDKNAVLMCVINNNMEKSEEILKNEEYIRNNFKQVKAEFGFEIYSLAEKAN
jgi:hypothetical protein